LPPQLPLPPAAASTPLPLFTSSIGDTMPAAREYDWPGFKYSEALAAVPTTAGAATATGAATAGAAFGRFPRGCGAAGSWDTVHLRFTTTQTFCTGSWETATVLMSASFFELLTVRLHPTGLVDDDDKRLFFRYKNL